MNQSFGIPEGKPLQISSAFASGFVATVVGSPLDVLKTRLMNAPPGTSPFGMIGSMIANEGPLAFYSGFTANFMRIGAWSVVMFLSLEQIKMFAAKGSE